MKCKPTSSHSALSELCGVVLWSGHNQDLRKELGQKWGSFFQKIGVQPWGVWTSPLAVPTAATEYHSIQYVGWLWYIRVIPLRGTWDPLVLLLHPAYERLLVQPTKQQGRRGGEKPSTPVQWLVFSYFWRPPQSTVYCSVWGWGLEKDAHGSFLLIWCPGAGSPSRWSAPDVLANIYTRPS